MSFRARILAFLILISLIFFFLRVRKLYKLMRLGKAEERLKNGSFFERAKTVLVNVLGQKKLFREWSPGLEHALIFWGFLILSLATVETVVDGFVRGFSFEIFGIYFYTAFSWMKELFGLLVIGACVYALIRRFITKPARFDYSVEAQFDATIILLMILGLMVTMFVTDASHIAMNIGHREKIVRDALGALFTAKPVSYSIANGIFLSDESISNISLRWTYYSSWWIHILILLGFINYIPYSKHLHVLTAIPNVFLTYFAGKGEMRKIDLEDESAETFGVGNVEEFTWKQLLDTYACTECGRCYINCPASTTGKDLSPRKIVIDIKQHLLEKGTYLLKKDKKLPENMKPLISGAVKENELWACTTCRACVQECPVFIDHIDKIVDMRRNLVLMESRFPEEVQATFRNMETNYNPWSFGYSARADWAEGFNVPLAGDKNEFEYLFWVGCAGSFDERGKKVSIAFTKILKKAGVDFAILGVEEKCTGDSARRLGNEYLAQILIKENIETLKKYKFKKIVTFCPHCLNAIKNDFSQFDGKFEVMHHSVLINDLIRQGKLKLKGKEKESIVYHDSCYLGRYNDIYDAPRDAVKSAGGKLIEMERKKDKGFCCGAGGGRMWLEENEGTRVNHERVKEALSTKADKIATACPFCLTMIGDGLKDVDKSEKVKALDIAEIVAHSID